MPIIKKHIETETRRTKKAVFNEKVVYITKTEVPAGKPLFAEKLKKVNTLLEKTILLEQ